MFGFRDSDWLTRTWTGGLASLAFALWVYPLLDQALRPDQRALARPRRAAVANGENAHRPRVVRGILDGTGPAVQSFAPQIICEVAINDENLEVTREGMHHSANDSDGQANATRSNRRDLGGKTGTVEFDISDPATGK